MKIETVSDNNIYREFIRQLRNNPKLKKSFITQENITKEQQEKYMNRYGNDFYVCIDDDIIYGFIGVVDNDLKIAVIPECQRSGIGEFMILEVFPRYKNCKIKVRKNNKKGINFFNKLELEYTLVD